MKKIRVIIIIMFAAALLAPVAAFNREENVVSPIDNRALMNNPFGENYVSSGSLLSDLSSYVEDRIGFRDEMILGYTMLNDRLFHKMVHPTYDYGEDGYVFFKTGRNVRFGEFHQEFALFIKKVQDYCEERGVPFLFVFNPAKTTVLSEKLRKGINYDAGWVQEFLACLDELGVNYLDNTPLLKEKTQEGEAVFNRVYNAGHWNDLGAFYGCNAILTRLQQDFPDLHVNVMEDYTVEQKLNTSLMVSEFPIHEYEPVFEPVDPVEDLTDRYSAQVEMDHQYRTFRYLQNPKRMAEGAPKVLSFQGSYMNGMGYKFLENSFGEYIIVHDYQNIFNLDYYFNIFQPDCVIFETAEYTLTTEYYNLETMKETNFYPAPDEEMEAAAEEEEMPEGMVQIKEGDEIDEAAVTGLPEDTRYAYLEAGSLTLDLLESDEADGDTADRSGGEDGEETAGGNHEGDSRGMDGRIYRASAESGEIPGEKLAVMAVLDSGRVIRYR